MQFWIGIATVVTASAAVVAIVVAVRAQRNQLRLEALRLRLDLFDKRFAVYRTAEEFVWYMLREAYNIEIGADYRRFLRAKSEASFLFGSDVVMYLENVNRIFIDLYPKCKDFSHQNSQGLDVLELGREITDVWGKLSGEVPAQHKDVFSGYLQLHEEVPVPWHSWFFTRPTEWNADKESH